MIFVIVFVMAKKEGSYLSICVTNGEKDYLKAILATLSLLSKLVKFIKWPVKIKH